MHPNVSVNKESCLQLDIFYLSARLCLLSSLVINSKVSSAAAGYQAADTLTSNEKILQ